MTTQPSDWAVRTAFLELTEAPAYEVLNTHFREEVLNRARELDASGGGPDPLGYTAIFNAIAAATWPAQEGVAVNVSVAKFHESIGGNVYATPRAAEAGNDFRAALEDLHSSLRIAYAGVPSLPIDESTMDAATDALHAFCLLIGIHKVEVGPYDAAMGAVGAGD